MEVKERGRGKWMRGVEGSRGAGWKEAGERGGGEWRGRREAEERGGGEYRK